MDRDLPADQLHTMDFYVNDSLSQVKFNTLLIGIFAALALLLAMMGIYGVLSNLVASRVREIGIRMAIGATPREIRAFYPAAEHDPCGDGPGDRPGGNFRAEPLSRNAAVSGRAAKILLTLGGADACDPSGIASGALHPAAPRHKC